MIKPTVLMCVSMLDYYRACVSSFACVCFHAGIPWSLSIQVRRAET